MSGVFALYLSFGQKGDFGPTQADIEADVVPVAMARVTDGSPATGLISFFRPA